MRHELTVMFEGGVKPSGRKGYTVAGVKALAA